MILNSCNRWKFVLSADKIFSLLKTCKLWRFVRPDKICFLKTCKLWRFVRPDKICHSIKPVNLLKWNHLKIHSNGLQVMKFHVLMRTENGLIFRSFPVDKIIITWNFIVFAAGRFPFALSLSYSFCNLRSLIFQVELWFHFCVHSLFLKLNMAHFQIDCNGCCLACDT